MQRISTVFGAIAVALTMALAAPGAAQAGGDTYYGATPSWGVSYTGVDFAKDSVYAYTGLVGSFNRDLGKSGLVWQAFGGYGSYSYGNPSVAGGEVDGKLWQFSGLLGYLYARNNGSAAIYLGVDYQNHDLDPDDPSNKVRGNETGFKVAGDLRHADGRFYGTLEGLYSTAFNSYWTRGRVGFMAGRFAFGPEGALIGNEGFDAQRIGGFLMMSHDYRAYRPVELTLSAGYQFLSDEGSASTVGGEGVYGGINLSIVF